MTTLHDLFDHVDPRIQDRVLRGTFEELFKVPTMTDDKRVNLTQ